MSKQTPAKKAALGRMIAAGRRAHHKRQQKEFGMSSGMSTPGNVNEDFRPQRAHVDTTPAVWWRTDTPVGDYQFIDDGLDEVFLRALKNRVVYAQNACCHREPPFQDLTVRAMAAACSKSVAKLDGAKVKKETEEAKKIRLKDMVFTKRQRQVIWLIAAGCTYEEIGEKLGISPRTAKMHTDVLRWRLNVPRKNHIPLAFKELTGEDPLALGILPPAAECAPPVPDEKLVEHKAAEGHTEGRSLMDVVSDMFE